MIPGDADPNCVFEHPHVHVLGVDLSAVDMNRTIELTEKWIGTEKSAYICMTGVHGVIEAQSNLEFRRVLNEALINAPDGMPMSWLGWLQGHRQMDRVYGPDFMANLCQLSTVKGYRHYLYGGQPGVASELKSALEMRFPGLQIVGTFTPPFRNLTQEEENDLLVDVQNAKPDILWVGLGTPKQERFMAQYVKRLEIPLLIGVGAAFDYHTGRLHESPDWIKRAGLQWLHRLMQDPRRLWRRYLFNNAKFIWRIVPQLLKLKNYERQHVRAREVSSPSTRS